MSFLDNKTVSSSKGWVIALLSTLSLSLILGAILLGGKYLFGSKVVNAEDVTAELRYQVKASIEEQQKAFLEPASIDAAIEVVAARLLQQQASAVEKPEQIIPGSATARKLEEAPSSGNDILNNVNAMASNETTIDPSVLEVGKSAFLVCSACHGQNGEGGPAGPPLAQSEWVTGPVSNLILIQLRGLNGPIVVNGVEYNFPAGMAPMAYQTDEQIAAVLTYIRNSFGNKASVVKPEQVAALRGEVGKPQITVEELIAPK